MKIEKGQYWRHHKGNIYQIECVANTAAPSDKFPEMVVYRNAKGDIWGRPKAEFEQKFTFHM